GARVGRARDAVPTRVLRRPLPYAAGRVRDSPTPDQPARVRAGDLQARRVRRGPGPSSRLRTRGRTFGTNWTLRAACCQIRMDLEQGAGRSPEDPGSRACETELHAPDPNAWPHASCQPRAR